MTSCLYIAGTCSHPECEAWPMPLERGPEPTVEDYCASGDHGYAGDDGPPPDGHGRCYCGARTYPLGGPETQSYDGSIEGALLKEDPT